MEFLRVWKSRNPEYKWTLSCPHLQFYIYVAGERVPERGGTGRLHPLGVHAGDGAVLPAGPGPGTATPGTRDGVPAAGLDLPRQGTVVLPPRADPTLPHIHRIS